MGQTWVSGSGGQSLFFGHENEHRLQYHFWFRVDRKNNILTVLGQPWMSNLPEIARNVPSKNATLQIFAGYLRL